MLEAKKFFPDCCILAFMIKTVSCTIIKLAGEKAVNAFPYCLPLGYARELALL